VFSQYRRNKTRRGKGGRRGEKEGGGEE